MHPTTTGLGRVRGVQYGYYSLPFLEPFDQVGHGGLGSSMAKTLSFWVRGIEEVGLGLRGVSAAVGANVEVFCRYRKPSKVADNCVIELLLDLA